ncbi:MAG: hypothetical protein ACTSRS_00175 [Candidatus Helarchaeota archaeon]
MELVTSAFRIALDEYYGELKINKEQIQKILDEFNKFNCKALPLIEIYEIFSTVLVEHWQEIGEKVVGRIFDLLFKEWDISSKIIAPMKIRTKYFYHPEEDF